MAPSGAVSIKVTANYIGGGKDCMRVVMSEELVLWEGGMYTEQKEMGRGCH